MEEQKMNWLKKMIQESNYLVCLMGQRVSRECGCTNYHNEEDAFLVEDTYGYSPEELFTTGCLNTRPERFYDYYKKFLISNLGEPKEGLYKLRHLEEQGILKCVITREIFSLAKRVGCQNVLELHGSVFENFCPHCKKEYSVEYIQNSKGIAKCEKCGTAIRPKVALVGEMVENQRITKACEEVGKADTLLILGCNMREALVDLFIRYFEGRRIIIINDTDHYADGKADLVIDGKAMDILAQLDI